MYGESVSRTSFFYFYLNHLAVPVQHLFFMKLHAILNLESITSFIHKNYDS